MALRSCLRDCPEVLSPNPYRGRTSGGYSPYRTPAPVLATVTPEGRPAIHWRTVLGVGSLAWLLIAGLIGGAYVRSPSTGSGTRLFNFLPASLAAWSGFFPTTGAVEPVTVPSVISPVVNSESRNPQANERQSPVEPPTQAKKPPQPDVARAKAPSSPPPSPVPEDPVAQMPQLPATELVSSEGPTACQSYGTQVSFVSNPADAAQRALKEHKLLFMLHLSGNLEDAKFT
jgi:hypothetical protein